MLIRSILFLFLFCLLGSGLRAQKTNPPPPQPRQLIQFSGVVVESDSLRPVPFTSIIIKNTSRGTVGDYFGYFSFVAQVKDTILFAALGYKPARYIIPDTLTSNKYSLIQVLTKDTISIKTVFVYPWATQEQFKDAFLKYGVPDDDLERARKNLARAEMKERMDGVPMDASLNYKYQMQQQYSRLYYAGQLPPNNLLNPIAWMQFIEAWKKGDFKKKN